MKNLEKYDFEGWATRSGIRCADGVTISRDAFAGQDGQIVPLVWNHNHNIPGATLGHALLQNRPEGVYAYGSFNNTPAGRDAKECVNHGDVVSLSIYANDIERVASDVLHGTIREVSLVHAGANPGAFIESIIQHGEPMDEYDDEGIVYSGSEIICHAADPQNEKEEEDKKNKEPERKPKEKTVGEIINTMTEEQKQAMGIVVGQAIMDTQNEKKEEEEDDVSHNIFENENPKEDGSVLFHSQFLEVLDAAKKQKASLRDFMSQAIDEGIISHSIDTTGMTVATGTQTYGFNDPSMLFPEFKSTTLQPEWISRDMGWVTKVMNGVHRTPFSRIKSLFANITEDEARARGYIKGKQKKEEVFTTLKRTTTPQTIYKLQKMDRDDIVDITDFDVVMWIKAEMRVMLNEEIARAILIGDGRPSDSEYKIDESKVRPIATDVPLFNTKVVVKVSASDDQQAVSKAVINAVIKSRKNYKGSGSPQLYTTEDYLTDMLLLEDGIGHKLYKTEAELATALRVSEIITVEPMENQKVTSPTSADDKLPLVGIIVNLNDYNVGADKGGEITNFEDFDIDFNQYKYLIETRISGALIKPFSAITVLLDKSGAAAG